jgi:hypothetical protein
MRKECALFGAKVRIFKVLEMKFIDDMDGYFSNTYVLK